MKDFLKIYNIVKIHSEFSYFKHTVDYYYLKIALKFLTLFRYENAIKIALQMESYQLKSTIQSFAISHHNIPIISLMSHIMKDSALDENQDDSLVSAMSRIANFSKKQLRKEDLANIYKDFETLIRVKDINDLELSDFNSWDIDLEEY